MNARPISVHIIIPRIQSKTIIQVGIIFLNYHDLAKKKLNVDIEIDGGINFENCSLAKAAGANILVSGSTIFKENKGDLKRNIEILRKN